MSRERRERLARFGIGIEVEIILHQRFADLVIGIDAGRPQCKVERGTGHNPEILIFLHQAAQPSVFQLFQSPDLSDYLAFARTQDLGLRQNRLNVVERAVSVENQRPNRHDEFPFRIAAGLSGRFLEALIIKISAISEVETGAGLHKQSGSSPALD